jgi:hypothetical protein
VRAELDEFLRGAPEWPSYADFVRAGRKSLRDAVTRFDGAERWAGELGLRYVTRKSGYAPRWTEVRIRAELAQFLKRRKHFPTRLEFEAAGRKHLRDAVTRTGGAERWAHEFGLPLPARRAGVQRGWTDEAIADELAAFLHGRSEWPSKREFEAAGKGRLLQAAYHWRGARYWARRLGLRYTAPRHQARARRWTEDRIRLELAAFCAGRITWPSEREFERAGLRSLYVAASRNGGVARWADELGLRRGRR